MAFKLSSSRLGQTDVSVYTTQAPGVTSAALPNGATEAKLGEISSGWDETLGWGEFIYLKVPASTSWAAGTLVYWTAGYTATILPALATSKNTGMSLAVVVTATTSVSDVTYGWFQIQGQATVLKTAVAAAPNVVVYASGTTGRIKILTSAGGQILGMRTANSATVTSTTSSVTCYIDRPRLQGQIT